MRHDGRAHALRIDQWAVLVGLGGRGSVGKLLDGRVEALAVGDILEHDPRAMQADLPKSQLEQLQGVHLTLHIVRINLIFIKCLPCH